MAVDNKNIICKEVWSHIGCHFHYFLAIQKNQMPVGFTCFCVNNFKQNIEHFLNEISYIKKTYNIQLKCFFRSLFHAKLPLWTHSMDSVHHQLVAYSILNGVKYIPWYRCKSIRNPRKITFEVHILEKTDAFQFNVLQHSRLQGK